MFYNVIVDLRLPGFCSRGVHVFQHVFQASSNIFQENSYNITRESRVPATHLIKAYCICFCHPLSVVFYFRVWGKDGTWSTVRTVRFTIRISRLAQGMFMFSSAHTTPNHTTVHHTTGHTIVLRKMCNAGLAFIVCINRMHR